MEPASADASHFHRIPYMTYLLLWINILVFVAILLYDGLSYERLVMGPKLETLILFGARQNGLIAQWQLERLFVPMFMHANLLHLGFNMFAFLQVGKFLELMFGARTLLATYLVGGVVGNIFSFTFIPSLGKTLHIFGNTQNHAILSVGASGSLFSILLFLFALQKYQQRLARETGVEEPRTNLGPLIVANGLITFLVPNIDWACHLGGALAGTILGIGVSLNHIWLRKQYECVKFFAFGDKMPKPKWHSRPSTWYIGLAVICTALMLNIFRTSRSERVLGLGILAAARDNIEERDVQYISQFKHILVHQKADTNPSTLLRGALALHSARNYRAAERVYLTLIVLYKQKLGNADFLLPTTESLLAGAYQTAQQKMPFPGASSQNNQTAPGADFCLQPANTFRNLGFLLLSGLMAECAFEINPKETEYAVLAVESYWRSERQHLLFDFLDRVNTLQNLNDSDSSNMEGSQTQKPLRQSPPPTSTPTPTLPRELDLDTNEPIPKGEEI